MMIDLGKDTDRAVFSSVVKPLRALQSRTGKEAFPM